MRLTKPNQTRQGRRGVVTVEVAFALPILFLIVFAAIEFSRANMIRNTAANAAYEGARKGMIPGATAASVKTETERILTAVGVKGATVTVTPSTITSVTPEVTVVVEIPYSSNSYGTTKFFKGKKLTRSITLRREKIE